MCAYCLCGLKLAPVVVASTVATMPPPPFVIVSESQVPSIAHEMMNHISPVNLNQQTCPSLADKQRFRSKKFIMYIWLRCPSCKRCRFIEMWGNDSDEMVNTMLVRYCENHFLYELPDDTLMRRIYYRFFENDIHSFDLLPGDEL